VAANYRVPTYLDIVRDNRKRPYNNIIIDLCSVIDEGCTMDTNIHWITGPVCLDIQESVCSGIGATCGKASSEDKPLFRGGTNTRRIRAEIRLPGAS
jgi:hypothetical protein